MLTSFVAVFYPFRFFTRVLWLILGPLSVWFALLFGIILHVRLNTAPGFKHSVYFSGGFVSRTVPATIFVYLLPLLIWLAIYQLGWRLRREGQDISSRSIQLKELLALTGVVGVITMLAQNSVPSEQVVMGKDLLSKHYQVLMVWAAIESVFLIPVILASFSGSHWLAIVACLFYIAISIGADCISRWLEPQNGFASYRAFIRSWPLAYEVLPFRGYRIVGSIALTVVVCISRWCGFRLVQNAAEKESGITEANSQTEKALDSDA